MAEAYSMYEKAHNIARNTETNLASGDQRWKIPNAEKLANQNCWFFLKKNIDQSEGTKISAVSRQNGVAVTHRTATYIDTNYFGHRQENELWKSCLTSFKWNFLKITKNARNICDINVNIYF